MTFGARRPARSLLSAVAAIGLATAGVTGVVAAGAAPVAHAKLAKNYAVGDSVMIDAKSSMYAVIPSLNVNADVSRQVDTGVAIVRSRKAHHELNDRTIFGLGTNGSFSSGQLKTLIHLTRGHKLVVITTHCPYCSWTGPNNRMIYRVCKPAVHCWVAPFARAAARHPEWFGGDGVHMPLGGAGAKAYAAIVKKALQQAARG